jgi:hypothetical protein
MKLTRRIVLHLALGAAAFSNVSRIGWAQAMIDTMEWQEELLAEKWTIRHQRTSVRKQPAGASLPIGPATRPFLCHHRTVCVRDQAVDQRWRGLAFADEAADGCVGHVQCCKRCDLAMCRV